MPAPAGGFTVFLECRPAQSLMSLRPFAASAVAERSVVALHALELRARHLDRVGVGARAGRGVAAAGS